jgi:hypothetical protein
MDLDLDKFSFENPALKEDVKVALKTLYDYGMFKFSNRFGFFIRSEIERRKENTKGCL